MSFTPICYARLFLTQTKPYASLSFNNILAILYWYASCLVLVRGVWYASYPLVVRELSSTGTRTVIYWYASYHLLVRKLSSAGTRTAIYWYVNCHLLEQELSSTRTLALLCPSSVLTPPSTQLATLSHSTTLSPTWHFSN